MVLVDKVLVVSSRVSPYDERASRSVPGGSTKQFVLRYLPTHGNAQRCYIAANIFIT